MKIKLHEIPIRKVVEGYKDGAEKLGDIWVMPPAAEKPIDGRTKAARKSKESNMHGGK
ncbi:MAG: DNA-binding protein [Burkholderiales bacterium]|jgi:hypothetical protein|nr:DNA-binding protein [Burkholderiales bacterium]